MLIKDSAEVLQKRGQEECPGRAVCRKMPGRMQCLPDGEGGSGVRVSAHLANRGAASWAAPKQTPESPRRSVHADFNLGFSWIDCWFYWQQGRESNRRGLVAGPCAGGCRSGGGRLAVQYVWACRS